MKVVDLSILYMFDVLIVCKIGKIFEFSIILVLVMIFVFIFIDWYKFICKMSESLSKKIIKRFCIVLVCFGIFFLLWLFLILMRKKIVDFGLLDINVIDCVVLDNFRKIVVFFVVNGIVFCLFCFEFCFYDFCICKDIYVFKKIKD